ncbi:MAG: hypothetical protein CL569_19075 [Alphaproteobacteria bacterium]|nr:hypothetical protein [Alphaproteobacteria bacterium]|tara:strand:- start:1040 stop:1576 length:537 start_codon:yes stop_codon:yes gene_type:complete
MFSKTEREKTNTSAGGAAGVKAAPSIISVNLHIIGCLSTDGEMQVDGSIEGDVTSQALAVGEKASISGEIIADDIEIHGSVSGKIRARKIKLSKTAKVIGDIWHEVLSIETGAYIEGQLKRAKKGAEEKEMPQPIKVKAAPVPEQSAVNAQTAAKGKPAPQTSDNADEKVAVKRAAGS